MDGQKRPLHVFLHSAESPVFSTGDVMINGFNRIKACFSDSPFIIIPINIENTSNKIMPITYAINAWLAGEDSLMFNAAKRKTFR